MSIGEIEILIEEGWQEYKWNIQKHADLKCAILNASWSHKKDEKLYEWKDFLPEELLPEKPKKKEISKDEQSALWSAAGNAYVNKCPKKKKTRTVRR